MRTEEEIRKGLELLKLSVSSGAGHTNTTTGFIEGLKWTLTDTPAQPTESTKPSTDPYERTLNIGDRVILHYMESEPNNRYRGTGVVAARDANYFYVDLDNGQKNVIFHRSELEYYNAYTRPLKVGDRVINHYADSHGGLSQTMWGGKGTVCGISVGDEFLANIGVTMDYEKWAGEFKRSDLEFIID